MKVSGSETIDRTSCRYQTGAEVVLNHIVPFLWGGESSASTALAIYPLLSEVEEEQ